MRLLIALLVSVNIALLAWGLLRPEHQPPPPPPLPEGPSLVMLSEAEQLPAPPAYAEVEQAVEPESASPLCLSLGAFQTPADLRRAMNALQPHVGRAQPREARSTQLRGYRVYLPALPSREQALEAARDLAGKGMRDYYVVTAGAEENTVSLGMFRELANAESRREEVRRLGHEARLDPRTEDISQWYLDIAAAEPFDWREHLGGYAGVDAEPIDCF